MHISRVFVWISVASLASVALGAPLAVAVDDEDSLVARDSEFAGDLSLRALTQAQIGKNAIAVLKKQQSRKATKAMRASTNKGRAATQKKAADARKAAAKKAGTKPTKMTPAQVKAQKLANNPAKAARVQQHATAAANARRPNAVKAKRAKKAKQTARRAANRKAGKPKGPAGVQGARKARVATRKAENDARKAALAAARAKLDKGPKLSRPDRKKALKAAVPPKPRPVNADRAAVTQHIKNSAQKMKTMTGIPSRNQVLRHPTIREQRTGKDVRKAVMNSHLHNAAPIGPNAPPLKPFPKHFGNLPNKGRPNAQPLPGGPSGGRNGMSEYPVTSAGAGWHNDQDKGAVRVITDNTRNVFHGVVTHPRPGSANENDYHKMT